MTFKCGRCSNIFKIRNLFRRIITCFFCRPFTIKCKICEHINVYHTRKTRPKRERKEPYLLVTIK